MADTLSRRILALCRLSMLIGLLATVLFICTYRFYQARYNERVLLDEYATVIRSANGELDEKQLNEYANCIAFQADTEKGINILHDSIKAPYPRKYLKDAIEEISASGRDKGVVKGLIYQCYLTETGQMYYCKSVLYSYQRAISAFCYSIIFGIMLILIANFLLKRWLKQTIDPLINAKQAQIQFFSDVSHDLKTPMAVISANTEVLELSYGQSQWTRTILNQVERMTDLVQQTLLLTKVEAPVQELKKETYPLGIRLSQELENFQVMAELKRIQYTINIDETITMTGDASLLNQLLIELLNNAVKYTPEGGTISANLKRKNSHIQLKLWNTHEPLDKEALKMIFERFYRVDASRCQDKKGFGIGLAVVHSIVEKHKGNIRAYNSQDGICFEVLFPIKGDN